MRRDARFQLGASAEIAVVGNEGLVGVSIFMGGESTPSRAVVQSAGTGCRMKTKFLMEEFNSQGPVMHLLLRRREGVTEGALKLQKAGLISYSRGRITVCNRRGLELRTCECYEVVKREYDRLLPAKTAV